MTLAQFIQWIEDNVADEQAVTHELDELVHDAKADEAADINNGSIESQLRYLLEENGGDLPSATIEDYCQRLEVPLPPVGTSETAPSDADWSQAEQQAAYQEGWGLFETGDAYEIQALDDPDCVAEELGRPFAGQRFQGPDRDGQAEEYVRRRAAEGDALAQQALRAVQWDRDHRRSHPAPAPALAAGVYDLILEATTSLEQGDFIGADLAYLLGAILKGNQCAWPKDRPLVRLLREHFPPHHAVWRYIEIEERRVSPERRSAPRSSQRSLEEEEIMSDRFPALIEIGGPISRALLLDLLTEIQSRGLRWNWCEDEVAANTPEQLLEELQQHNSEALSVGDDEARGGMFPDLEGFLVEHGIGFNRHSDAKYEYDGEIVFFRRGMKEPGWCLATQDGKPATVLENLQPIRELLRAGDDQAALKELDALLDRIPPLPPLTIQENS